MDPIVHLVTNKLRLRQDTPGGKVYLEAFENGAWTVKAVFVDAATGQQEHFGDIRISKATPALRLSGTETGAKELVIRENTGVIEIYDVAGATVIMTLENHGARHASGGADAIPAGGLVKTQLAVNTIQLEVPVPLGYIPTGLATDATGVKSESKQYLVSAGLLACAKAAYFESDLQQLTGGTVDLELYDYTAAAVRASLTLNATTKRQRSADILASLVAGNPVAVRFNVTTAGAAGSLGGGCSPVLILVLGVS